LVNKDLDNTNVHGTTVKINKTCWWQYVCHCWYDTSRGDELHRNNLLSVNEHRKCHIELTSRLAALCKTVMHW